LSSRLVLPQCASGAGFHGASTVALSLDQETLEALALHVAAILDERERRTVPTESRYLRVAEAATYLRCTRQRVYDLCRQGSPTRLKDGSRVLLDRAELDAYLRSHDRPIRSPSVTELARDGSSLTRH
jgi:excisionase family DNA binding protein